MPPYYPRYEQPSAAKVWLNRILIAVIMLLLGYAGFIAFHTFMKVKF